MEVGVNGIVAEDGKVVTDEMIAEWESALVRPHVVEHVREGDDSGLVNGHGFSQLKDGADSRRGGDVGKKLYARF